MNAPPQDSHPQHETLGLLVQAPMQQTSGAQHSQLCHQAKGPALYNQWDILHCSPCLIKLWNSLPWEFVVAMGILYMAFKSSWRSPWRKKKNQLKANKNKGISSRSGSPWRGNCIWKNCYYNSFQFSTLSFSKHVLLYQRWGSLA